MFLFSFPFLRINQKQDNINHTGILVVIKGQYNETKYISVITQKLLNISANNENKSKCQLRNASPSVYNKIGATFPKNQGNKDRYCKKVSVLS